MWRQCQNGITGTEDRKISPLWWELVFCLAIFHAQKDKIVWNISLERQFFSFLINTESQKLNAADKIHIELMQCWSNIQHQSILSSCFLSLSGQWIPCALVLGKSEESRSQLQQQYYPWNNHDFSNSGRAGGLQHSDVAHSKGKKINSQKGSSRTKQLFLVVFGENWTPAWV